MLVRIGLLLGLLFGGLALSAQHRAWSIEAGSEFGWWLHQLGDAPMGVAKTHHSGSPFLHLSYLWPLNRKWALGPTVRLGRFLQDDMRQPRDSRRQRDRVFISGGPNESIPFVRYGLRLEHELLRRGAYSFAPALQYGAVFFDTTHPDRANFGYHHFVDIMVAQIWHRRRTDWILQMNYSTQRIFLKEKNHPLERHHLYTWGVSLGVRF